MPQDAASAPCTPVLPSGGALTFTRVPLKPAHREHAMPLCFIEPQDAIRVIAESVGREARRQLLGEVVRAWVDEIPEDELMVHYEIGRASCRERV